VTYKKQNIFTYRTFVLQGKRKFRINQNSNIDIGLNIGLLQLKNTFYSIDVRDTSLNSEWLNYPIIDIGASYRIKKRTFGLSYSPDYINLETNYYDFNIIDRGIIAFYCTSWEIIKNLNLYSDIYVGIGENGLNAIISSKFEYKDFITVGVQYNTNQTFGFMVSGTILHQLKLSTVLYKEETIDGYSSSIQWINLGFIIR